MFYINKSCGLEPKPIDTQFEHRHSENGIHYLAILHALKMIHGIDINEDGIVANDIISVIRTWNEVDERIEEGVFDRGAYESLPDHEWYHSPQHRRKISHDNLSAISALSREFDLPYAKQIAKLGVSNGMRFDNKRPHDPQWKYVDLERGGKTETAFQPHPRDWFFWLYNAGGIYQVISYMFFWAFFIASIISCFGKSTSGKLLLFVKCEFGQRNSYLIKGTYYICKKILRYKYGKNWIKRITKTYFGKYSNHPIMLLVEDLEL